MKKARDTPSGRLETLIDRIIPFALLALLILIVFEFLFVEPAHVYEIWIDLVDLGIIGIFAIDLSFKYNRARDNRAFVREYWMEIIAIIPFYLIFRVVELFTLSSAVERGQAIVHAGTQAERGLPALLRTSESSRLANFTRFLRAFLRAPRFAKAAEFFREPR